MNIITHETQSTLSLSLSLSLSPASGFNIFCCSLVPVQIYTSNPCSIGLQGCWCFADTVDTVAIEHKSL